ncbi:hypothetical protein ACWERV_27365 [Streptomyces sp. NPDC004031]
MTELQDFYAAESAYIAAGGMGEAGFDGLTECLDPDVVMYQAPGLPYGERGAARAASRQLITVEDRLITEMFPFSWEALAVAEALKPR